MSGKGGRKGEEEDKGVWGEGENVWGNRFFWCKFLGVYT